MTLRPEDGQSWDRQSGCREEEEVAKFTASAGNAGVPTPYALPHVTVLAFGKDRAPTFQELCK